MTWKKMPKARLKRGDAVKVDCQPETDPTSQGSQMNLDFVETLRKMVAEEAVDLEMRSIPQLQVPAVEFVVPSSMEGSIVLGDMVRRLAPFPNVTARIVKKGTQYRVRMEYRT